jgi:MFS transporter, CP family, cyanate transporter
MTTILRNKIIAILSILFLSLNLRGPFTSLAPVLEQIMDSVHLSSAAGGFLTALPLLAFALFSPLAGSCSRKLGLESSLILALFLIAVGIVMRSSGMVPLLYLGTLLIGVGVAIGNVLLPVVVKVNFPGRIAMISALYVFTMGIGSTLSSSLMVPLSGLMMSHSSGNNIFGWQMALLCNIVFPIAALTLWLPKLFNRTSTLPKHAHENKNSTIASLLRSSVAWQVTLGLGFNSFTFYSFAGWLPKILGDLGYNELDAGYIYGFLQFATMLPGLLLLPILARKNNQQRLIFVCSFSLVIGVVGLLLLPQYAIFWVGLFGGANCATFIIAISFIGLRTDNPAQAASLSAMSQSIGYALAATGPTILGHFHDLSASWELPLMIVAIVGTFCTVFATLAARDKKVFE